MQFHYYVNVIYNLAGIAYYAPRLYGIYSLFLIGCKPVQHIAVQINMRLNQAQGKMVYSRDTVNMRCMRLLVYNMTYSFIANYFS